MKNFLMLLMLLASAPLMAQITGNVMKVQNDTGCDKYVLVRESDASCNVYLQAHVVPPNTTIAVFATIPGTTYFDAAQVADFSGSMASPTTPGCFNVKVQGAWTICPIGYPQSDSGVSCCPGNATVTADMVMLYPGSNAAYLLIY